MRSSEVGVSVIAVVADEPPARLARMLAGVGRQQWPGPIEVVVAAPPEEGPAIRALLAGWARGPAVFVANPGANRAAGLNAASRVARGDHVARVDARSTLPAGYLRRTVARLSHDPAVAAVGGHQWPVAEDAGRRPQVIARALRNHVLLGNAPYRRPAARGAVDTVYLGVFRRADLLRHGWDERLTANEDFDLCQRLRAEGHIVYLEPDLLVGYEPRGTLGELARQYHAFGCSKVVLWRDRAQRPAARQLVALGAAAVGITAGTALLTRSPRAAVGATLSGSAAYLAIDAATGRTRAGLGTRLATLPVLATIHSSWLAGIVTEVLRPRSGDVEHALERDARLFGGSRIDDDPVHDLAAGE